VACLLAFGFSASGSMSEPSEPFELASLFWAGLDLVISSVTPLDVEGTGEAGGPLPPLV